MQTQYEYDGDKLIVEYWNGNILYYVYDQNGSISGMRYRKSSYAAGVFDEYLFEKNLQGDIVAVYDINGTKLVSIHTTLGETLKLTYHKLRDTSAKTILKNFQKQSLTNLISALDSAFVHFIKK